MEQIAFEAVGKRLINLFGREDKITFYNDGLVEYKMTRKLLRNKSVTLNVKDVTFYVDETGFFTKLLGKRQVYFGGKDAQLHAVGLTAADLTGIKEALTKLGSPIGESGTSYRCWNLKSITSWFRKEYVTLTESGVTYKFKNEMSYIPYSEIKDAIANTSLLTFGYDLFLCADQYICPRWRVHGNCVARLKAMGILKKDKGKSFYRVNPGFLFRLFHPFAPINPRVFMTDRGIYSVNGASSAFISRESLTDCDIEREHFYSWRGTVVFTGAVASYRDDQDGTATIISKDNIGRFKWWGIKRRL